MMENTTKLEEKLAAATDEDQKDEWDKAADRAQAKLDLGDVQPNPTVDPDKDVSTHPLKDDPDFPMGKGKICGVDDDGDALEWCCTLSKGHKGDHVAGVEPGESAHVWPQA